MVGKQKPDERDALHILDLLLTNRVPRIWIPSPGEGRAVAQYGEAQSAFCFPESELQKQFAWMDTERGCQLEDIQ